MAELKAAKEKLKTLSAQRDLLEVEAEALHSELTSAGANGEPPAGLRDALVDAEGFPRGDIDIYHVKQQRLRLSSINVEHREVMKAIEDCLLTIHALSPEVSDGSAAAVTVVESSSSTTTTTSWPSTDTASLQPMAVLDEVLPSSPAEEAGIRNGDLLLRFGDVTSQNGNPLPAIAKVVSASLSQAIEVEVRRGSSQMKLTLVPRTWGGRGLLGCHLSPLPL